MVYIGISKFSFATRQCSVRCSSGIRVQSTSTDDHGKVTFTKLVNTGGYSFCSVNTNMI